MSTTPIDIHCSRLVDWLVQHRHCRKDWGENLSSIRRKIRSALKDMPENEEIKQILVGSKLDYFNSKRIVEILRTTEASSKNIFGYYSSQRMREWQDIVSSYEKDCIYLAEIATDLIRETNYEIPGIRKVIQRLNREKGESEKERSNWLKKSQLFISEHQKLGQSYGIKGVDVVGEFDEEFKTLPVVMKEIEDLTRGLKPGLCYYRDYAHSTTKLDSRKFLPLIGHLIEHGNTTVFEYKNGYPPESISISTKATSSSNFSEVFETELGDEIDFGDDLPGSESSNGFVHIKGPSVDIDVEEEAELAPPDRSSYNRSSIHETEPETQQICVASDRIACGDDAKLVLEFLKTRNQYLNNLHELEAFYNQLSIEAQADDHSGTFLAEEISRVNVFQKSDIDLVMTTIQQIFAVLNKDKNKILFLMNECPSMIDNIKEKFASKLKQASECQEKSELSERNIVHLGNQIRETELHLKRCIVNAKELQEKIESSLRDLYNGRPINIMGCVG